MSTEAKVLMLFSLVVVIAVGIVTWMNGCAAVPAPAIVAAPQGQRDAGASVDGEDGGVDPGCVVLCARCPELQPVHCTQQCSDALEAADAMLDPGCVQDAADCDQAVACVK